MKARNIYIFENVKLFYSKKYVTSESNSQYVAVACFVTWYLSGSEA